jgi:hypothetical protein
MPQIRCRTPDAEARKKPPTFRDTRPQSRFGIAVAVPA